MPSYDKPSDGSASEKQSRPPFEGAFLFGVGMSKYDPTIHDQLKRGYILEDALKIQAYCIGNLSNFALELDLTDPRQKHIFDEYYKSHELIQNEFKRLLALMKDLEETPEIAAQKANP